MLGQVLGQLLGSELVFVCQGVASLDGPVFLPDAEDDAALRQECRFFRERHFSVVDHHDFPSGQLVTQLVTRGLVSVEIQYHDLRLSLPF